MIYYTIYVNNLHNGTGYIDIALEDDQLLKDYQQYLDIGMRPHRSYAISNPGGARGVAGQFAINMAEIVAVTVTAPKCNFLLTNGGTMQDYWGVGKAAKPMLPLIAIPTTAGTGSECQSFALISDEKSHQKMACGDPKAAAAIAILDPLLTLSQPARVTACTGIDAIAHVVETAVTTKRTAFSLMCSHEGFKLTVPNLPRILQDPQDIEARGRMQLGAAFAGMAIENSMLGAAHAAANPLTAHYGIAHGQAVGMMLPQVVRFNGQEPAALQAYAQLASAPEIACVSDGLPEALDALVAYLEMLLDTAGMPRSLADCGVERSKIPALAEEAAQQWTASFNPRPIDAQDFVDLYEAAFESK